MPSRQTNHVILICGSVLLALLVPSLAAAQDFTSQATIVVRLASTSRTGSTGAGQARDEETLKVGDSMTAFLQAGINDRDRVSGSGAKTFVTVGAGSTLVPKTPFASSYEYAWRVQVALQSIAEGRATFEVDWNRYQVAGEDAQPVAGDRRTITLPPGARHVLDFIDFTSRNADATNVVLELEVPRLDAPRVEYSNTTLAYDVWLVHEPANGQKVTQRLNVTGRDGQVVPFRFAPLAFSLETTPPAGSVAGPVKVTLDGSIKGRMRPDGGIDLAVQSSRLIQCTPGLMARETGTKSFVVKPDETTSIELPFVNGYCPLGDVAKPANPRPGVMTGADGKLRVNFKEFFAGDKTSILVTAKRQ